jgi:Transport and Golgi organisation 2
VFVLFRCFVLFFPLGLAFPPSNFLPFSQTHVSLFGSVLKKKNVLLNHIFSTTLSTVSPPRERAELKNTILVPPFESSSGVSHGIYGTRLAQVILVRRDGLVTYVERDVWVLDNKGVPVQSSALDNMRSFTFTVGTQSSES